MQLRRTAGRGNVQPVETVLPTCLTPELEYLQVKWAAHAPYAAAPLLRKVLPVADKCRLRQIGMYRSLGGLTRGPLFEIALEPPTDDLAPSIEGPISRLLPPPQSPRSARQQFDCTESAVNQVVSHRMAKKRQVRWYEEGAHLLAQVGVHELNDQPKPREISTPLAQTEWRRDLKWDAYHPPQVAA